MYTALKNGIAGLILLTFNTFIPIHNSIANGITSPAPIPSQYFYVTSYGDYYVIHGQTVFRLDSSGSTLWSRNFSAGINSFSPFSNQLSHITVNEDRVFILTIQRPDPWDNGDSYPALIVMDTSGNTINIHCREVVHLNNASQKALFNSNDGGVWWFFEDGGISKYLQGVRLDKNGNETPGSYNPGIQNHSTHFKKVIKSDFDSTYLILANWQDNYWSGLVLGAMICYKMDYTGNVLWANTYYNSTFNGEQFTFVDDAIVDSHGNIYLGGDCYGYNLASYYVGYYGIKLNSSGQVISSKYWTQGNYNNFIFSFNKFTNDSMYVNLHSNSTLSPRYQTKFDTSFNTTCILSDSSIAIDPIPISVFSGGLMGYQFSVNYNPIQLSATTARHSDPQPPEFCLTISISEYNSFSKDDFLLFPSPVSNELNVRSNKNHKISKVEIYSVSGIKLFVKEIDLSSDFRISTEKLSSGVYILRLYLESGISHYKFTK